MDRADLERLFSQVSSERTAVQNQVAALQGRLNALMKTADGLQALLEMTPEPTGFDFKSDGDTGQWAESGSVSEAERTEPLPHAHAEKHPKGKEAAKLILQGDTTRFWTVRDVWAEQVRRGWTEPGQPGKKRNAPARIALWRLQQDYPENVDVIEAPVLSYRWTPEPSPSLNGSGASHARNDVL